MQKLDMSTEPPSSISKALKSLDYTSDNGQEKESQRFGSCLSYKKY